MSAIPNSAHYVVPNWPAAANVRALVTTRRGGVSKGGFSTLNLAAHVADEATAVKANRSRLAADLQLPASQFCWLQQVHGSQVVEANVQNLNSSADASYSSNPEQVCVVMTADCLPVLLANRQGTQVAAVHAGWRGLAGGVLQSAVARFADPADVMAWFGPAIGPAHFEVGDEVRQAFCDVQAEHVAAFEPAAALGKWYADIYQLAKKIMHAQGVYALYGGGQCTYSDAKNYYSYRRDGARSGRMASLIWLQR